MIRATILGLGAILSTGFTGCGNSGPPAPPAAVVSGVVKYKGAPLPQAHIRFVPAKGTKGPVASADVKDGVYEVKVAGGVPVGTHKVEITALRPSKGAAEKSNLPSELLAQRGTDAEKLEQFLPAKYNTATTLEFTVSDTKAVTKDFELGE